MSISTKNLLYKPFEEKTYQTLQDKYEEFRLPTGHLLKTKVIDWIIICYDLRTELRQQYPDWRERKIQCARLAGWEASKNGVFQDVVMEMLNGENEAVNDMVTRYCLLFNSPYYTAYVSMWEMLVKETRSALSSNDSKTIETMRKNIAEMTKQIEFYADKIFGGESTIGLQNSLFKTINREKLRLRPEDMAQDIKDKDMNLPDQYYEEGEEPEEKKSNAGRPKGAKNKKDVIYKRKRGRPKVYVTIEKPN